MGQRGSTPIDYPIVEVSVDETPKNSYAVVVNSLTLAFTFVPLVLTPISKKSEVTSVQANRRALQEQLKLCEHSLIARVILAKGEKPWMSLDL